MPNSFFKMQLPVLVIAGALIVGLVAWKEGSAQVKYSATDTVPKAMEKKIRNLDDALEDLEKGEAELKKSMEKMELDFEVPVPSVPPISPVEIEKIMADVEKAIKEIDPVKLKTEIEASLKDINPEAIKAAVAEALEDIDIEKIKLDVQASLSKENMKELNLELEHLKNIEIPKLQAELKNLKPEIEEAIKNAKVEIAKAKEEIKEYKAFEDGLEKDGLINKDQYTVEHKDGQLYINGQQQPASVYNKYRSFLEKHKKLTIKKDDGDFNINAD